MQSISEHLIVHIVKVLDGESLEQDVEDLTIQGHGFELPIVSLTDAELEDSDQVGATLLLFFAVILSRDNGDGNYHKTWVELQVHRIHVLGPLSDRALVGDYDIFMGQSTLTDEALVSN